MQAKVHGGGSGKGSGSGSGGEKSGGSQICNICESRFYTADALGMHMQNEHRDDSSNESEGGGGAGEDGGGQRERR